MIRFIGDIHSLKKNHEKMVLRDGNATIQVGDFGWGFPGMKQANHYKIPENNFFIRGNHDSPSVCKHHPAYLGDFGCKTIDNKRVFFVSGAHSIDIWARREGVDWWADEELSYSQMTTAFDRYMIEKPDYVVSHDCPNMIAEQLTEYHERTATSNLLTAMFEAWKPKYWIFGHYHTDAHFVQDSTEFFCVKNQNFLDIA